MTKKKYQKPEMQVCPMMKHAPLICGSNTSGSGSGTSRARRFGSPWDDDDEEE